VNYAPVHFIPAWTEVPRFMNVRESDLREDARMR